MQSLLYGLFGESPWNSESGQIPYKIINDSLWAKLTCFPYNNIYIICYHYNYPFKMSFCVWVSLVWSSQCVTNCMLCLRAVTGVDVEPDLVHMEIQDIGGGKGAHVFIEQCISIQFYIPYQTTANKGRWDVLGLQFASFKKNSFREIPPGWAVL